MATLENEAPAPIALPMNRFLTCVQALGGSPSRAESLVRLIHAGYTEPHRAYHGTSHIAACLRLLDRSNVASLAQRIPEVECALWLHDIVYDTHASDNEEQSAELARRELHMCGVPMEAIEPIAAHILATKTHQAESSDTSLVLDIDLSILGAPAEIYTTFETQIRSEYSWVPDSHYRQGRRQVLERFLSRPHIFVSTPFRTEYEAQARVNLKSAIAKLDQALADERTK